MNMFRQGDVMIRAIRSLPTGAAEVHNETRVVLAYGEVTGHAHALAVDEAREFTMTDAKGVVNRYLQSLGKHEARQCKVLERVANAFGEMLLLDTPDGITLFSASDVVDIGETAMPKANYSRLVHEEHRAQGLLQGFYGINQPQREYTPEAIRNVAD